MGCPVNSTGQRLVNGVVVDEYGHSQDVHGHVSGHDIKDAFVVLAIVVEHVVDRSSLDPGSIDLEEQGWQVGIAVALDDTLGESPVFNPSILEHLVDKIFVVKRGDHQSR